MPFTAPNDLTFSDISPIGFLANCVEDEKHFAGVALFEANWAASRYCVAVTCLTSPRACICLVEVHLQRMPPPGWSLNHWTLHLVRASHHYAYRCAQNHLVFVHTLANSHTSHTVDIRAEPIMLKLQKTMLCCTAHEMHQLCSKLCSLSAISLSLLSVLANFKLPCLCLVLVRWLEVMLRFRETSLYAEQNSFPAETFRLWLGNSRPLATGVTDFGSVEEEGFFLRLLDVAKFCLTTRLRDSTDCCRAMRRSSSDGAGEKLKTVRRVRCSVLHSHWTNH